MAWFPKIDDIRGESPPPLASDRKNRLRQMGISIQGLSQLEAGKLITNRKDMQIIAKIVSAAI